MHLKHVPRDNNIICAISAIELIDITCAISAIDAIPISTEAKVPVAKVPVAKVPVAKVPVAKVPVAKVPVAKVPMHKNLIIPPTNTIHTWMIFIQV